MLSPAATRPPLITRAKTPSLGIAESPTSTSTETISTSPLPHRRPSSTTLTAPAPRSASARTTEQTELIGLFRADLLEMVERQLTYDALRILGFDSEMLGAVAEEMKFMQALAHEGKIIQGRFAAKKGR